MPKEENKNSASIHNTEKEIGLIWEKNKPLKKNLLTIISPTAELMQGPSIAGGLFIHWEEFCLPGLDTGNSIQKNSSHICSPADKL